MTSSAPFHRLARPTIGSYSFTIPATDLVTGITISGTFGNGDSATTALSDYYLGFSGNEMAVPVAGCDSISADCAPPGWPDPVELIHSPLRN